MFKTFGVLPVFLVMTVVYISGCSSQKESASNTAPASAPSSAVQTTTTTVVSQTTATTAAPLQAPASAATATAPAPAPSAPATATEPSQTSPTASSSATSPLATADAEQSGVRAELQELKRTSDNMLKLKFSVVDDSDKGFDIGTKFADLAHNGGSPDYRSFSGINLIDEVGKKKYFVVRDTEGSPLCSRGVDDLSPKSRALAWAEFPAPPANVQKITVSIPHFEPMTNVPISQ